MAWANNKASTILSCWQEASSGKTFLVFYHNYYIIIYSNLHSEYMKPKQKIKYQKKGNVIISASYPSLPLISIKNAYTLEQKWIPAGVVTYKRISIQVLDSNLKTWKIADLDISNLPDLSPPPKRYTAQVAFYKRVTLWFLLPVVVKLKSFFPLWTFVSKKA